MKPLFFKTVMFTSILTIILFADYEAWNIKLINLKILIGTIILVGVFPCVAVLLDCKVDYDKYIRYSGKKYEENPWLKTVLATTVFVSEFFFGISDVLNASFNGNKFNHQIFFSAVFLCGYTYLMLRITKRELDKI